MCPGFDGLLAETIMTDEILAVEPALRLSIFIGVLVVMLGWETLFPKRKRSVSRWLRWPNNLALTALNTGLLRVLFPVSAVGLALGLSDRGWGLLNLVELPCWLSVALAVVALDLAIYVQHVVFHAVPLLWRLHRMHHTDLDLDVTSGTRFHPLEMILSMLIKFGVLFVIGPPAVAVLIFEVVLNAMAMFNHANARIPQTLDRVLRMLVVTPDMHRVHHSVIPVETNSNFGFNLSLWDRLFRTYRPQPEAGHTNMVIGLPVFRSPRELWLDRLLVQPLRDTGNP